MRRRLVFWRALTVVLGIAVIAALSWRTSVLPKGERIARVDVTGVIYDDPHFNEQLAALAEDDNVKALILNINSPGATRSNRQIRARALSGTPVNLRFNTNFDNTGEPDRLLTENTTYDDNQGYIVFGVPLSELAESLGGGSINNEPGSRVITLDGRVAVPGAQDQWPNSGGSLSFTF